jgi:transposase InsO family protein
MLACVTGQIEDSLRQKIDYVLEENRVYRALLERHSPNWRLEESERRNLAEKGKPLGKWLAEVITIVKPETLLQWHRRLVAKKWDFSRKRTRGAGRPAVDPELENLIVQFAHENPSWGYDRIMGALANLGYRVSDQTVGNILRAHGLGPAPERKRHTTWTEFIGRHKDVLWATDFFTAEVWSSRGLITIYVLFFIQLRTRKIVLGGLTPSPNEAWVKQIARNVTGVTGELCNAGYLIHDRDTKYTEGFDQILEAAGIEAIKLPPKSPNLNAFAERWILSVKVEILDQMILFGERSLAYVIQNYIAHHHHERNHQGLDNVIPFPDERLRSTEGEIMKSERLGGLLNFYCRKAA